jgi:hypothetical protein
MTTASKDSSCWYPQAVAEVVLFHTLKKGLSSYLFSLSCVSLERSLAFSALLWRSQTEFLMEIPLAKCSVADRRLIRLTMEAMEKATVMWRQEMFDKKRDPYLAQWRPRVMFMSNKGGGDNAGPFVHAWLNVEVQRWGKTPSKYDKTKPEALEGWLDRHPYAENMQLSITVPEGAGLEFAGAAGKRAAKRAEYWGVYDILVVPADAARISIKLDDNFVKDSNVTLPAGVEITYGDFLNLAYEQNRDLLNRVFQNTAKEFPSVPYLLPAVLKQLPNARYAYQRSKFEEWLLDFWTF